MDELEQVREEYGIERKRIQFDLMEGLKKAIRCGCGGRLGIYFWRN